MCACFRGYLTKGSKKDSDQPRLEIVQALLRNGARADYSTPDTKMTAIHWAAYNKDYAVVKELLVNNAPEFHFSHMGNLPIDVAGSSMAENVIDICLNHYYERVAGATANPHTIEDQEP